MSDHDSKHDFEDQSIEQVFSSLKKLEPPLESRVANREAIAAELARLADQRRRRTVPFWRRTISVPWPVAAAALAMLVALPMLQSRSTNDVQPIVVRPDSDTGSREDPGSQIDRSPTPTLAYYETTTYLCGIGPLRSASKYVFEE